MLHKLKFYVRRARELAKQGELLDATVARARSWRLERRFNTQQTSAERTYREYSAALPDGLSARRITLRLSVPPLPVSPLFAFSDHVADDSGRMTGTVLAVAVGGFAISRDLGRSWSHVRVKGHGDHRFVHLKSIGGGELLAQASPPESEGSKTAPMDLLVLDERGEVLAAHKALSQRWHGCRAVDIAGGTLMFAEYPSNMAVNGRRPTDCRVLRSRDRGRSWQTVFEQSGRQIRHFHFLQARPGVTGEWWLSSGDLAHESRIWRSRDDGDSWLDVTAGLPKKIPVGGALFEHGMFRLTDLNWLGEEIVWATDDVLASVDPPGSGVFRSRIADVLAPQLVGRGKWHIRSIVDIGDFYLFLSQRSNKPNPPPEDRKPGVYLMPKTAAAGAPALVHLFDLDTYPSRAKSGFTFSKASRTAVDGTFFTFRSSEDVFPAGHKMLEWNVSLE